jgi:hypothetical protein
MKEIIDDGDDAEEVEDGGTTTPRRSRAALPL